MELDFSPVWAGWPQLLRGAWVTVEITAVALVLGCVLGLLVGIGRLKPERRIVYGLCTAYVAAIRGTPLLVQLFLLFFGLPQFGILLPAFFCGVIGLGIYSGAYVSEIVRGSIQSIDRGQMEAARSLGAAVAVSMMASRRAKASTCRRRSGVSPSSGTSAAARFSAVTSRCRNSGTTFSPSTRLARITLGVLTSRRAISSSNSGTL